MSTFGDALKALRQVVLLQSRLDQMDGRIVKLGADLDGLVDAVGSLRDRVSRLEGVIEGAAMATRQRRIEE